MSEIKSQFSHEARASYTGGLDQFASKKGAWKKEFEKQLYNNSQMKASDHSYQKKAGRVYDAAKTPKDFLSVFDGKQDSPAVKNRGTVVSQSSLENGSLPIKESTVIHNTTNNLLFNSGTNLVNNSEAKSISKTIGIQNTQRYLLSNIDTSVVNTNDKAFNIKVMPDGEIIVRHYLSSSYNKNELHSIVKDIQTLLGKHVDKLRVNGELVWENTSDLQNKNDHTYKVNLIF